LHEEEKNKKLRKMIDFMLNSWELPLPEQVISVTGAADESYHDGEPDRDSIKDNLKASLKKKDNKITWIITGGSDSGVMKLVGEVVHETIEEKKKKSDESWKKLILIGIGTFEKAATSRLIKKKLVNSLKFNTHS